MPTNPILFVSERVTPVHPIARTSTGESRSEKNKRGASERRDKWGRVSKPVNQTSTAGLQTLTIAIVTYPTYGMNLRNYPKEVS